MKSRVTIAIVVLLLLGGGVVAWKNRSDTPARRVSPKTLVPPDPDLTHTPPTVARAVRDARDEVLHSPDSARAWGELGMIFFAHQFEAEANLALEHAAQLDDRDFRWPYLWGLSVGVSDPARAEQCYRAALAVKPDQSVIHTRLGELLLGQGRLDAAETEFNVAIAASPRDVRALLGLARVALSRGDATGGLEHAQQALQLAPDVREVHETLAQLSQRAGQRDAAARHLQLAESARATDLLWRDPVAEEVLALRRDARSSLEQAEQLVAQNRPRDAARLLADAIGADDRDPELYVALGKILINAGVLDDAAQVLDQGLRRHPKSAELEFQRGVVDFLGQKFAPARGHFEAAVAVKSDYALAYYNLGHACLKLNDTPAALDAFQQAVRIRPEYVDARINVGRLLLDQRKPAAALPHLRMAVQLAPRNKTAVELLARAEQEASQTDAKPTP